MSKLLVIDTETGGLDASKHSLLSLGAVVWADGVILDTLEVLVAEPELSVEPDAMRINQIDLVAHRQLGLTPFDAMKKFLFFLERNFPDPKAGEKIPIAGHNVNFDVAFVRRLCMLSQTSFEDLFSHRLLDTAGIIRFLVLAGRLPSMKAGLNEALDYFGIKVEPARRHTALADATATALLLNELIHVTNPARRWNTFPVTRVIAATIKAFVTRLRLDR